MNDKRFYLSRNLQYLRRVNNETQKDIAKICGKGESAVSNWENGIREPDTVDLAIIANHYNITVDELMFRNLEKEEGKRATITIPLLATFDINNKYKNIIDYLSVSEGWIKQDKKYFALQISDNSMSPNYLVHDIVIFEESNDFNEADNKDCIIQIANEIVFRSVMASSDKSGISLVPNNLIDYKPAFYTNMQIIQLPVKIVGIAIERRTKL